MPNPETCSWPHSRLHNTRAFAPWVERDAASVLRKFKGGQERRRPDVNYSDRTLGAAFRRTFMSRKVPSLVITAVTLAAIGVAIAPAAAERKTSTKKEAAFDPSSLPDQEIGRRFVVTAKDLPPPKTGPVVSARPLTIPYKGQTLRVPDGFVSTPFATGLEHPRRLLVLPNGDVLVAEQSKGHLTLLRDEDGDGKAEWMQRHVEGLNQPYGLAWRDDHVLVADQDGIWKVPHKLGALRAGKPGQKEKAEDVP